MSAPDYLKVMTQADIGRYVDDPTLLNAVLDEHHPNIWGSVNGLLSDADWMEYLTNAFIGIFGHPPPPVEILRQLTGVHLGFSTLLFGPELVNQLWNRDPRTLAIAFHLNYVHMEGVVAAGTRGKLQWLAELISTLAITTITGDYQNADIPIQHQLSMAMSIMDQWLDQYIPNAKVRRITRYYIQIEVLRWFVSAPTGPAENQKAH